jgi:hypothetical protein
MKILPNGKSLVIVGGVFVIILVSLVYVLVRIGGAYKSGLAQFSSDTQISDVTHTERQKIKKITIKNSLDSGCLEVMPDGIIRVFTVCEKELSDARRVTDTKYILQLYKKMTETDITTLTDSSNTPCDGYSMILETDVEKKSVCLSHSSGGNADSGSGGQDGGAVDEIITIIDHVIDDIPPTPTQTPNPGSPTAIPNASGTATPTIVVVPSWGSTPTPTIAAARPFICDFTDAQGKKRPYTISNIICSTEPSPGPSPMP